MAEAPSALELLASKQFLQLKGALCLLAQHELLDVLEESRWDWLQEEDAVQLFREDILMPLTQLSSLRAVLRQPAFRSLRLVETLKPFPRIKEDLLDAWFQVESVTLRHVSSILFCSFSYGFSSFLSGIEAI